MRCTTQVDLTRMVGGLQSKLRQTAREITHLPFNSQPRNHAAASLVAADHRAVRLSTTHRLCCHPSLQSTAMPAAPGTTDGDGCVEPTNSAETSGTPALLPSKHLAVDADATSTRPSSSLTTPPQASNGTSTTSTYSHHIDAACHPRSSSWFLPISLAADATLNPIRAIVDRIKLPTHHLNKPLIPLSIGDPTTFGNLDIPTNLVSTLIANLQSRRYNGYAPSTGSLPARQAVATRYSYPSQWSPATAALGSVSSLTPADVIITSGCSGALTIAIEALCNPSHNILLPRPGFSLYRTICGRNSIEPRFYNLRSNSLWEVDLSQMESLIDANTAAILVNNPSNPNGSNWSLAHVRAILDIAERHRLPIIADEVYADMVFEGQHFYPFGAVSERVPVVTVGGIAKQYVCPGWRVGWACVYDKGVDVSGWREGMNNLSQLIIGANTLVQSALPDLLLHTPASYHQQLLASLQSSASYLYEQLNLIRGLSCTLPQGAMYLMVKIDCELLRVRDEQQLSAALLDEENVFVLPGSCFQAPGFVRLVCCAPVDIMAQAVKRMRAFCERRTGNGVSFGNAGSEDTLDSSKATVEEEKR